MDGCSERGHEVSWCERKECRVSGQQNEMKVDDWLWITRPNDKQRKTEVAPSQWLVEEVYLIFSTEKASFANVKN